MCDERERLRWEERRRSLANFCKFGSCSGRDPVRYDEAERIVVEIGPRKRSRRMAVDEDWENGSKADDRGRWAVRSVMSARRREGSRAWELLVEWMGDHEPSWVRLSDLDKSLREEAREVIAAAQGTPQVACGDRAAAGRSRRAQTKGCTRNSAPVALSRKRSPRLMEAEVKRRKLSTALVVVATDKEQSKSSKKQKSMHGVRRIWGYHVDAGTAMVHVEWEERVPGDREIIPTAWLSEDLQAQAQRLAEVADVSDKGVGPLHPFFLGWSGQAM